MNFFYEQRTNRLTVLRGELEFDAHIHSHIEIVFMRRGECDAYIDGNLYELKLGDCLIIFPNRIHNFLCGKNDLADVLIIATDELVDYKSVLMNKLPTCPLIKNVSDEFGDLFNKCYETKGEFSEPIRWGLAVAVVGNILKKLTLRDENTGENKRFQKLLEYCNDNFKEDLTIPAVAEALNLSQSYVSHLFSDKFFIGFRQYINSLRINEALRLLEDGELSNTEISCETGFGTIRTFNRVFYESVGCTPSAYRKALKTENKTMDNGKD